MSEDSLNIIRTDDGLASDVRRMITQTREGVARTVNAGMALLYWRIGKRIQTEVLQNTRAAYGKEIVSTPARQLVDEFSSRYGKKKTRHQHENPGRFTRLVYKFRTLNVLHHPKDPCRFTRQENELCAGRVRQLIGADRKV